LQESLNEMTSFGRFFFIGISFAQGSKQFEIKFFRTINL
jgi:hypothetical protein